MKKTLLLSAVALATIITVSTAHAENLGIATNATLGVSAAGTQTNADASVKASLEARGQSRGVQEIDRRIAALNKLSARVNTMVRVSADEKTTLQNNISSQISVLTDLKTKISADTDAATLKADLQSITKSYRIFMVVLPQGAIAATADRISTTADLMTTFGTKLQTRISAAATAGHDVSALNTAFADYTAKIADAKTQTSVAINLTENLKPDNGDQATIDSNKQAITTAHTDIKTGQSDLEAARADAATIVKALKGWNVSTSSKTSTTTSVQ